MVTLNTLLLVGLIVAPVASVATVGLILLTGIYLTVRDIKKLAKKDEDEDGGVYTMPLSALQGMGGRMPTQAEVDQVKAAIAQSRGGGAAPEEKREAYVPGGYV